MPIEKIHERESNIRKRPDIGSLKIAPEMKSQGRSLKPVFWIMGIILVLGAAGFAARTLLDRPVEVRTMVVRMQQTGRSGSGRARSVS